MAGGTLVASRYVNWFPQFKMFFDNFGFPNTRATATDKDGLNMQINELKPDYVLMDSNFYYCGTPYMVGQLLSVFPKLNIAIVTVSPFPDDIAIWFILHGIKIYIKLINGFGEFNYGLRCFLDGKKYIAPDVQKIYDELPEIPDVLLKNTRRHKEILLMLCNGFSIKNIEDNLHVCKATVEYHIRELKKMFGCGGREELIKTVHCLDIFSKQDLCFCASNYEKIKLPDWARTQQFITRMSNNIGQIINVNERRNYVN